MRHGFFACFEGGEGAGKGSAIAALQAHLAQRGITAIVTREPGGTQQGQFVRKALVESGAIGWDPVAELLLLMADRAQHVKDVLRPALQQGSVVLCDRYVGSTLAYQGAGRGLAAEVIERVQGVAADSLRPDLTVLLDIEPQAGLARSRRRLEREGSREDSFERLDLAFHQRVRDSFLAQAAADPARWAVVDAAPPLDEVSAAVINLFDGRLPS